jgi:DNA-binding transcriptional ArsR family regulator
MTNKQFEPQRLCVLASSAQIKGYVHPTRMLLLEMLAKEKRTISSIARELGVHPANITHHFKLLERSGLILLVEKRDTGKNLEKYYRATAYTFAVKPGGEDAVHKKALALSILKNDLAVAVNSVRDTDDKQVSALLGTARINAGDVGRFIVKLEKLIKEFKAHDAKTGVAYNINLSLYPNDVDRISQKNSEVNFNVDKKSK